MKRRWRNHRQVRCAGALHFYDGDTKRGFAIWNVAFQWINISPSRFRAFVEKGVKTNAQFTWLSSRWGFPCERDLLRFLSGGCEPTAAGLWQMMIDLDTPMEILYGEFIKLKKEREDARARGKKEPRCPPESNS